MYELNDDLIIEKEIFKKSTIYKIDNFYKNPEEIESYLFHDDVPLHKIDEKPSYNNIHFEDRRSSNYDARFTHVVDFLSSICNQRPLSYNIVTNQTRFKKHNFNDYKNNYWYPHKDEGYNAIIYFSDDDGTNLYKKIIKNDITRHVVGVRRNRERKLNEHFKPWKPKKDLKVVKKIKSKYNRLVLFDGRRFLHGMDINSDRYFCNEYRKNQVLFFA